MTRNFKGPLLSGWIIFILLFAVSSSVAGGRKPAAAKKKEAPKKQSAVTAAIPPPVIIIDPGHGGKDPGAISKKKIREKEVVLAISKKLVSALRRETRAAVFLTRSADRFITLEGRDQIANRKSCDLFLSIHANAAKNKKAEGLEIYYLNKATDQASRRLAARENEGAPKREKEIEAIVSDLIQTAATEESADLAQKVKISIGKRLGKKYGIEKPRVKTALFYVLVGAKCPSLLIETGFITNTREGGRLKSGGYQVDLAKAIAEGVALYFKTEGAGGDL